MNSVRGTSPLSARRPNVANGHALIQTPTIQTPMDLLTLALQNNAAIDVIEAPRESATRPARLPGPRGLRRISQPLPGEIAAHLGRCFQLADRSSPCQLCQTGSCGEADLHGGSALRPPLGKKTAPLRARRDSWPTCPKGGRTANTSKTFPPRPRDPSGGDG